MPEPQPQGCLGAILKLIGIRASRLKSILAPAERPPTSDKAPPYRRKDYLLSRAERSFFGVLNDAMGGAYHLFPKVRLADLLWMPKGTEGRQTHFNRIQSKHIDFVVCDRQQLRPLLAIELDDASHRRASRQARDQFVDDALKAAGLPILRFPARSSYHVGELRDRIVANLPEGA